ncbi:MAG: group 1 truncated hemoglobin, partial [Pseudomonadota bacterium]
DHQTKFVSSLMGGPALFTDTHIENAHKHLTIYDAHFDKLKELINETLGEFGVDGDDVETVLAAFEQRRRLLTEH